MGLYQQLMDVGVNDISKIIKSAFAKYVDSGM
jgi:hypothetical protein